MAENKFAVLGLIRLNLKGRDSLDLSAARAAK
jgi:hypothetical protein